MRRNSGCTSWTRAWISVFLSVTLHVFPCANYRIWNVFVSFSLWLHLLSVCLSTDITKMILVCVCVWMCLYAHLVVLLWSGCLKLKANLLVTEGKQLLYNRTLCLFHSSAGFPSACLEMYHHISFCKSLLILALFIKDRGEIILNPCILKSLLYDCITIHLLQATCCDHIHKAVLSGASYVFLNVTFGLCMDDWETNQCVLTDTYCILY